MIVVLVQVSPNYSAPREMVRAATKAQALKVLMAFPKPIYGVMAHRWVKGVSQNVWLYNAGCAPFPIAHS